MLDTHVRAADLYGYGYDSLRSDITIVLFSLTNRGRVSGFVVRTYPRYFRIKELTTTHNFSFLLFGMFTRNLVVHGS